MGDVAHLVSDLKARLGGVGIFAQVRTMDFQPQAFRTLAQSQQFDFEKLRMVRTPLFLLSVYRPARLQQGLHLRKAVSISTIFSTQEEVVLAEIVVSRIGTAQGCVFEVQPAVRCHWQLRNGVAGLLL